MKKVLLIVALLAAVSAGVYVFLPEAEQEVVDHAAAAAAKEVQTVAAAAGDRTIPLSIGNTELRWSAIKTLAGKQVKVVGGWDSTERNGVTGALSGELLLDSQGQPRRMQAEIQVGTLWTENTDSLTPIMFSGGFFDVKNHPVARFVSTAIVPGAPAGTTLSNATHTVEGNFRLNGVEKSITFPVVISVKPEGVSVLGRFGLNRHDFNCRLVNSPAGVLLGDADIDPLIAMTLIIRTETPATAAGTGPSGSAKVVDVNALPAEYAETVPATQVRFDMVLVKGDPAAGIAPFYLGKREVTWDEFMPWVTCQDVADAEEHGVLRSKKLRPSSPYTDVTRDFGINGFPALGMSRLSAELYCQWLSAQTGKKYRLPTEKEWDFAYRAGRGTEAPLTAEEAKELCVYEVTSFVDDKGDYASRAVGSRAADKLGVHDLAGNVCEWVTGTDPQRVARGGHFQSPLEELGVGRHVEDMDIWNMNYPNEPKSIWWFVDARWVGFRVVCEP
jgi:polyisoprenoid-binding protein YceI